MSQGAESAALPPQPAVAPRPKAGPPRPRPGRPWLPLIPALVTLGITLFRIQGPSITRDEDATLLAVHRTFPQLVRMLGNIDVVHGAYYSLIWVITRVFGTSELAVRFPSAVAMAVAAGGVTLLGRRLVSTEAGLAAGLVFAVLPSVSWYAEDARDYAIVTALAVAASYVLVRALDATERRRRWLIGYGVILAFLGLGNLFALLIVLAHAVTIASRARRDPAIGRSFVVGWLVAVVAAVVAVSPVIVAGYAQLHLVKWIKPVSFRDVRSLMRLAGTPAQFYLLVGITVVSVVAGAVAGRSWLRAHWPERLVALALPWLVLPPAVLLVASLAHPVYNYRYVAFCIPALALVAGTALAALGRMVGEIGVVVVAVGLIAILVVGLPLQVAQRGQDGHGINIEKVNQIVARNDRPGDALLNINTTPHAVYERALEIAYPYGLARLRDVSRGESAAQSGTIGGTFASPQVERSRLATVTRLWAVGGLQKDVPVLHGLGFTLVRRWHVTGVYIRLYTRDHAASGASGQAPASH
jgi:mannosyltransferase